MDESIKDYFKARYDVMYEWLDLIESRVALPTDVNGSLRDLFKAEAISFLVYLSMADGSLDERERDYINYLFDLDVSRRELDRYIADAYRSTEEFEQKLPRSLQILSAYDRGNFESRPVVPEFIELLEDSGVKLLQFDEKLHKRRTSWLLYYINMLESNFLQDGTAGGKKTDLYITRPTKPKVSRWIVVYTMVALLFSMWTISLAGPIEELLDYDRDGQIDEFGEYGYFDYVFALNEEELYLCVVGPTLAATPCLCYVVIFWQKQREYNAAQRNFQDYSKKKIETIVAQKARREGW